MTSGKILTKRWTDMTPEELKTSVDDLLAAGLNREGGLPETISKIKATTAEEILEWSKRFSYKPNTILQFETVDQFIIFALIAQVPDANDSTRLTEVMSSNRDLYRNFSSFRAFKSWVLHCIRKWENHETDEWFRIDGVRDHDPHLGERFEQI